MILQPSKMGELFAARRFPRYIYIDIGQMQSVSIKFQFFETSQRGRKCQWVPQIIVPLGIATWELRR